VGDIVTAEEPAFRDAEMHPFDGHHYLRGGRGWLGELLDARLATRPAENGSHFSAANGATARGGPNTSMPMTGLSVSLANPCRSPPGIT
jgi:hypothetical protein